MGGFGGIGMSIAMMGLSALFNRGGDDSTSDEPEEEFRPVASYAQGTPNTSRDPHAIPAMLHPNEAVIPLTGNRKVPVEMTRDDAGGAAGKTINVSNTFHIQTKDADSFRKSQKQIAADMTVAGQAAARANT